MADGITEEWIKSLETFNKNRVQQLYKTSPALLWQPLPFDKKDYPHFMTHLSNQELLKDITIDQCYSIQLILILIYEKEATININAKEIVAFLIEMCDVADLNTFYWGSTKNTTLHLACNLGQLSIIRQLINHGVSIDILNDDNLSPMDFATSIKVIDILNDNMNNNIDNSKSDNTNINTDNNNGDYNNNINNNKLNISKKTKDDNTNNSNRFEKLRQFAEERGNNSSSSSLSLPTSIQRQNSTRKYVQPGHIETRKRQVLQQKGDDNNKDDNTSSSNNNSGSGIKKDITDTQKKSSKLNTTNKRLQEVESLAKQSRVKNNPLFKKFEQQSNNAPSPITSASTPIGKRSLKIPNMESIQDRRISKGITSLKDKSFVSASVFRQKSELSASSENLATIPTTSKSSSPSLIKSENAYNKDQPTTTTGDDQPTEIPPIASITVTDVDNDEPITTSILDKDDDPITTTIVKKDDQPIPTIAEKDDQLINEMDKSRTITTTTTNDSNKSMDNMMDESITENIEPKSKDDQSIIFTATANIEKNDQSNHEMNQPAMEEYKAIDTIENKAENKKDKIVTVEKKAEIEPKPIVLEENDYSMIEEDLSQDTTLMNNTENNKINTVDDVVDDDDNDNDEDGFDIIDDYAGSYNENENTVDEKIKTNDKYNDDQHSENISEINSITTTTVHQVHLNDVNRYDSNDIVDDSNNNNKEELTNDKKKNDNINNDKEIEAISPNDHTNTSPSTTMAHSNNESTTNINNKRISALRMSHLSLASNSTEGEQWFDSYEENVNNEARKSAILANITNYYKKTNNEDENNNKNGDGDDDNVTPRQSFVPPNYDPTISEHQQQQQNHPDSASASTSRYSRGSVESHATFRFQSYDDNSDTESSNSTWPPPSPTKVETVQRIQQITIHNNNSNSNNSIINNNTIDNNNINSEVLDDDDDDDSIYEEQQPQIANKIQPEQPEQPAFAINNNKMNKNNNSFRQKEDDEESTGHVIVATQTNFVVHRLSHFQRMYDEPSTPSTKDRHISNNSTIKEKEKEKEKVEQTRISNDDYIQTKTEIPVSDSEQKSSKFQQKQQHYHDYTQQQQYNQYSEQQKQYDNVPEEQEYNNFSSQEQHFPILPLIPEAASSGYGKLYVRLTCAQDILLPIPLETTYVRCVINDGLNEYISRYEVLSNKVNFKYETTIDTHPDMIITVALQVRPDPHVQPLTGISRFFTTVQRQKKTLVGYVHPEEHIIGQSRFALSHMVQACDQKTYSANFDCFNSWFARTAKERKRLANAEDGQVLKVVGNLAVDLLYLPVSDPSMKIPKTLQECDLALKIRQWHGTCWRTGYLSTRPIGGTVWQRNYFQLIGSQLLGYHNERNIQEPIQHYNITEAIQLTVAADQVLVDVNKMNNNIPAYYNDDSIPFNYSKNAICKDNQRGFFRITFANNSYIDCVCDHVKESELWVNTFRRMIGSVPLTVSASVFLT